MQRKSSLSPFAQQYQRPIRTLERHGRLLEYIEVTLDDIAVANRVAHEILGRSLDELAPQTRRLLALLHTMVTETCTREAITRTDYRFSRKTVRAYTSWSDTVLRLHLKLSRPPVRRTFSRDS